MFRFWTIVKVTFAVFMLNTPQSTLAQTFPIFDNNLRIGIVDQDALFTRSRSGKIIISSFEVAGKQLALENISIQEDLEEEELSLTEQRKTLAPDEFEKLALLFDAKVKKVRSEQATKERELNLQLARDRATFYERITPLLLAFLEEREIEVLLNKDTVVLATRGSDITQAAIQRINEVLKEK
jgi:Skp family chaperone for outer membrane proteins